MADEETRYVKLHNPAVTDQVRLAIKLLSVKHKTTMDAMVRYLLTSHPLTKAQLAQLRPRGEER